MTCDQVKTLIADPLMIPLEGGEYEAHLMLCPDCKAEYFKKHGAEAKAPEENYEIDTTSRGAFMGAAKRKRRPRLKEPTFLSQPPSNMPGR